MNIRTRLTLQFTAIFTLIMLLSSLAIYYFSAQYRYQGFNEQLENKANILAKLLIDYDEINADLLLKIERNDPSSLPYQKLKVYDKNNMLLFTTDYDNTISISSVLLDKIWRGTTLNFNQNDFQVHTFIYNSTVGQYAVIAAAKDVAGFNKLHNLRDILMFVFAVSLIVIALSGWIYSGRALKPISNVVAQVDGITASHLDLRVEEGNSRDEIAQLAKTFNRMLDRIESAFKIQETFIANASHELRTPLAAITGQLEVTLMKEQSDDKYRNTLVSVLEDMRSLNQISNQLLLLAQTSGETQKSEIAKLRLDEMVWEARADLLRMKKNYTIDVIINEAIKHDSQLTVTGNEFLLKTAIINLMDNGCKYSNDWKVEIDIENKNGQLLLNFKDNGIGIDQKDLQFIYEPFFRGKNAKSFKGHGIGLSLVKRIVNLQNGTISISSILNKGSVFTLTFPT